MLSAISDAIHSGTAAYVKKFARQSDTPTSVLREFMRTRKYFVEMRDDSVPSLVDPLLGEAKKWLSVSDLDRAIFYLWNVIPKWSPVGEELEERSRLQTRLVELMRDLAASRSTASV